jgi:hypothetical protein
MWLDALGWTATGIFSTSYFFRQPAALRKIQAGAALLWVVYGMAIHSAPVVVANLIVGVAAIYTSFRATLGKHEPRTETVSGDKQGKDGADRIPSRLIGQIARLSYVPALRKDVPEIYMLPICTMVWCGALPIARPGHRQESVAIPRSVVRTDAASS